MEDVGKWQMYAAIITALFVFVCMAWLNARSKLHWWQDRAYEYLDRIEAAEEDRDEAVEHLWRQYAGDDEEQLKRTAEYLMTCHPGLYKKAKRIRRETT